MAEGRGLEVDVGVTVGRLTRQLAQIEARMIATAKKGEAAFTAANTNAARSFARIDAAAARTGSRFGGIGSQLQQASFQVQDFAVQVAAGTSAMQAGAQQLPQLLGMFGVWGAVAGAAAAALIPLAANILMTGEEAETAEERIERLRDAVKSYVDAAKAARAPTAELAETYGDMAGAARQALRDQAALERDNALRALASDADALAASLSVVERLGPRVLAALADPSAGLAGVGAQRGRAAAIFEDQYNTALADLAERMGISEAAAADLYAALQRLMTAEGPEAQAEAAQEAHDELVAAAEAAGGLNEEARAAAGQLIAIVLSAGELDGAMSPVVQKAEEFSLFLRDAFGWAQRVRAEMAETAANFTDGRAESLAGQRADRIAAGRSIDEAVAAGILALIRRVEGTAGPNGYNTTLGNGRFLPGGREVDLTNKTLAEIRDLQRSMLANPDNTFNSSAVGAYQIVGQTLERLIEKLGLDLSEQFTPELQDRLARELIRERMPQGLTGFQNEWEGIRDQGVTQAQLTRALGADPTPTVDPGVAREAERQARLTAEAREAEARAVATAQSAYDRLAASLDPMVAAQQALAEGQAVLKDAYDRGLISLAEYEAGLAAVATQFQTTAAELAVAEILAANEAALAEAEAKLEERRAQLESVAQNISSALGNAFVDAITGAQSFGDAMRQAISGILADLARLIIQQTIYNALAKSMGLQQGPDLVGAVLGAFGGARAAGGPVTGGKTYLVGERGPELFSPGSSGTIIPNHRLTRPDALASRAMSAGSTGAAAPNVTLTPAPVENVVLLGDADAERLVMRPGVQRNVIRLIEREGFRRG